jgi:hypothetical protein
VASYDAQINLLVSGQRELARLADRLRAIERQIVDINSIAIRPQPRDPATGRFTRDPDRETRLRAARLRQIGQQEERSARLTRSILSERNRELLRSIEYQSKLNSAVDLYERKLEQLSRGGGGERLSEALRSQIRNIREAYDAATEGGTRNLSIVRSLATELGRVVERQNELNRLSSFQSKAFFSTQAFERRIAELRAAGAPAASFGGVGRQIRALRSATARGSQFEAEDISRRLKESLDRVAREIESTLRQARARSEAIISARKAEESWRNFFEYARNSTLRIQQTQKDAQGKLQAFFDDAAAQALEIRQNARDTSRSWREFFEDAAREADRLRGERLSRFARLRGKPNAYDTEAGPLPAGAAGGARFFQERETIAKELLSVETEIAKIRQDSISESIRLESERVSIVEKRKKREQEIRDVLLEAVTFGRGADVKRAARDVQVGTRNALVRGGLGLGALGIGGAYAAAQEAIGNIDLGVLQGPAVTAANAIGGALNGALGGVPAIINDMLSALGNVPGSLGLASVAALAFAPAMKTAADAVFLAGKSFGETKFGENIKLTLDRQTNLFESVINKASEMSLEIGSLADKAKAAAEEMSAAYKALPRALPAAGETSFRGAVEYDPRIGAFAGGGARALNKEVQQTRISGEKLNRIFGSVGSKIEFLADKSGDLVARSKESADATRLFAEGLGEAVGSVDRIAVRLKEAKTYSERISVLLSQAFEQQRRPVSVAEADIQRKREARREVVFNRRSAEIARERSRFLLGAGYAVSQVPPGGELLPGGRTETRQKQYRDLLNAQAVFAQRAKEILATTESIENLERKLLGGVSENVAAKKRGLEFAKTEKITLEQINKENERSIQIIRERNKELRQRPIAAMTPQERVSQGILDPRSLRADRERRIEIGRLDPLERFYAGFQPRRLATRSARATSEGLIGGAFPLLFGQGIGAAALGGLGGAAGGFAGGGLGFGLSLIGTALGTAFDTAVQGATELGDALNDTSATFDKVKERALFSSKETEGLVNSLQELGFVASAAILSQREVISKIGASGANSLTRLSGASDKLNRAWAELNLQLQAALAGPMAGLLEWVADIVGIANQRGRSQAAARDLIPQDEAGRKRFEKELTSAYNRTYGTSFAGSGTPRGSVEETIKYLSMDEKGRAALAELSKTFKPIELDVKIKEKQQIEEELAGLTKKLEIIDLGKSLIDQVRSAQREQEDLDKQRADLVRSYEESIGDIRKRVEDEVASRRFSILEKENQLLDQQGQNRLKQLQLANQEIVASAGRGERPEIEQAARNAAEIVARFTEDQLSAEEEAAKIKRDAALDSLKFDYQAAEFKASIEKEVSRLNIETARRVADINEQVRRRNEELDNRRFAIEKQIADLQLKMMQNELALATKNADLPIEARRAAFDLYQLVGEQRKQVKEIAAPPALRGVGQVGGSGVSTQSIDAVVAKEKAAIAAVVQAAIEGQNLLTQQGIQNFKNSIDQLISGIEAPVNAISQSILDADQERLRYSELISQGLTDTVAQRVIEIEKARDLAAAQLDNVINELEKRKAVEGTTEAIRQQIEAEIDGIKQRKKALEDAAGVAPESGRPATGAIGKAIESEEGKKIQDFVTRAQAELNDLESVAIRVSQGIGDAVGNSLTNGIAGLIEGTATAKEVFAGFLKDVGQILLSEAAKMIATYIAIGIAKMFAGLAAGGGGQKTPPVGPLQSGGDFNLPGTISTGIFPAANGAYFSDGVAAFANGGMFTNSIVSSPTLFQFADGGVTQTGVMGEAGPEAIMPLERGPDGKLGVSAKLSGAMSRYSRPPGAAGGPEGGSGDPASTGEGSVATGSIDVRYTVERINSVDYVTADQFRAGMAQAAQEGAQRGQQLTLRRLQQSPATRRKLGVA